MYKLTQAQADLLFGIKISEGSFFNPIQDINGDWFISIQEIQASNIEWLQELVEAEFVAPIVELP